MVFGGTKGRTPTTDVFMVDFSAETVTQMTSFNTPRSKCAPVKLNDKFYLIGGKTDKERFDRTMEMS